MKNVFISQPMNGVSLEKINEVRKITFQACTQMLDEKILSLIDQVNIPDPPGFDIYDENYKRISRLSRSLGLMAAADVVVFVGDWEKANGCKVERIMAEQYGLQIINIKDWMMGHRYIGDNYEKVFPELGKFTGTYATTAYPIKHFDNYHLGITKDNPIWKEGDKVIAINFPTISLTDMIELECAVINPESYGYEETSDYLRTSVFVSEETADNMNFDIGQGEVLHLMRAEDCHNFSEYNKLDKEYQNSVDEIYPITIITDRYTGTYSGGEWTAWALDPDNLPECIFEGDVECANGWHKLKEDRKRGKIIFGIGNTPEAAVRDLVRANNQITARYEKYIKTENEEDK